MLGAVDCRRQQRRAEQTPQPPELLYAVTSHRPRAKTVNILQWSGSILGQSKNLLFGKLLVFLRFFRPDSLEVSAAAAGGGGGRG
jgi:hypothetical protein